MKLHPARPHDPFTEPGVLDRRGPGRSQRAAMLTRGTALALGAVVVGVLVLAGQGTADPAARVDLEPGAGLAVGLAPRQGGDWLAAAATDDGIACLARISHQEIESGCLACHRWNCDNHLRHRTKAAR